MPHDAKLKLPARKGARMSRTQPMRHEQFLKLFAFALSKFSRYEFSLACDLRSRRSHVQYLRSIERTLCKLLRQVRLLIAESDQMLIDPKGGG